MKQSTHKNELQQLFPSSVIEPKAGDQPNTVKIVIDGELSRIEIGHLFSLGMISMKRSGTGISVVFDLSKASLNFNNETI